MNIKTLTEFNKTRKGKASGTTKNGSYWIALDIEIIRERARDYNRDILMLIEMQIRHFRSGDVIAVVTYTYDNYNLHQSAFEEFESDSIPKCETIEDVIIELKNLGIPEFENVPEGSYTHLKAALKEYGLSEYASGPDTEPDSPEEVTD